MTIHLTDITDAQGNILHDGLLQLAESVHRELRPHIESDYLTKMRRVFADGGRMTIAHVDTIIKGLAVWRIYEDTFSGRKFYCDDLVTTSTSRSHGVGKTLIAHMTEHARTAGCDTLVLDSGTQRTDAHRFYFREDFVITSFNFKKSVV